MEMRKLCVALLLVSVGGMGSSPVKAQELFCDTVSVFIGGAAGAGIGASANLAISAGLGAVGAQLGDSVLSGRCQRSLKEFGEYYQKNPVNHIDFVRDQCGGNPLNCPGNLNPHNPWQNSPFECWLVINCGANGIRDPATIGPFNSVSVNDLISAMTFVDISISYGYWATAEYGHLVGLESGHSHYTP